MDGSLHGGDGKTYEKGVKNDCKGQKKFTEEALSTFLTEVESITNSRPLTPASDDIDDLQPITQNHLLLGRPSPNFQPCVIKTEDINLRKRWRAVQTATDMFWCRLLKEYVPLLTKRKKWNVKNRNFQVGDLVLIVGSGVPHSNNRNQNK